MQRQSDERFLFDLALTRAREGIVLSYPQLNAKGEANLPSFFLQHARPFIEDRAADVRPTSHSGARDGTTAVHCYRGGA